MILLVWVEQTLTVEARIGDLVIPHLSRGGHSCLDSGLVLLLPRPTPVGILTHPPIGPVQLPSLLVVIEGALVCPPLGHSLQLSAPHLSQ